MEELNDSINEYQNIKENQEIEDAIKSNPHCVKNPAYIYGNTKYFPGDFVILNKYSFIHSSKVSVNIWIFFTYLIIFPLNNTLWSLLFCKYFKKMIYIWQ